MCSSAVADPRSSCCGQPGSSVRPGCWYLVRLDYLASARSRLDANNVSVASSEIMDEQTRLHQLACDVTVCNSCCSLPCQTAAHYLGVRHERSLSDAEAGCRRWARYPLAHVGSASQWQTHRHELPVALLQRLLHEAAGVLATGQLPSAAVQHPHRRRHAQVGAQPCLQLACHRPEQQGEADGAQGVPPCMMLCLP